jgi:hypothetical protein
MLLDVVLCAGHLDINIRETVMLSHARDYPALDGVDIERNERRLIPPDSNCKSTFRPVPSLNDRHLPPHVTSRSIKDFVGMAVIGSGEIMTVAMRSMEMNTVVRVHSRHDWQMGICR